MQDMMIAVDLAKSVFQFHDALKSGEVNFRKRLTRQQFQAFMAIHPPALVIFEAFGGAQYWVRQMQALCHEVRLISPQYVRPFVERQKITEFDKAIARASSPMAKRLHTMPCLGDRGFRAKDEAVQARARFCSLAGPRAEATFFGRKATAESSRMGRLLTKKPRMLVAIALANKMARQVWAMLKQGQDYKDSALAPS